MFCLLGVGIFPSVLIILPWLAAAVAELMALCPRSLQDWIGPENEQNTRPVQPLVERIGRAKGEHSCFEHVFHTSGGSQTVVKVVGTVYDWLLPRPEFGRFFLACPLKLAADIFSWREFC